MAKSHLKFGILESLMQHLKPFKKPLFQGCRGKVDLNLSRVKLESIPNLHGQKRKREKEIFFLMADLNAREKRRTKINV